MLLLLAVSIWGLTFVATKICLGHLTPLQLLGARLALAVPVLLGLALVKRTSFDLRGYGRPWLLGSALIGVHFYIQTAGLQYTTATRSGWIIGATPVVMAFLAALLLRERIERGLVLGIAVSTAGVLLLVSDGDLSDLGWLRSTGDWLVLASAHTWALYTVATRNLVRERPPLVVTTAVLLPATVVCVVGTLWTTDVATFTGLPLDAIVSILFLGVLGMAVAHWFWQHGVRALGAARAGSFLYLEPLSTTALAVTYLGEPFGPFTLAGGALVLAGVWLAQRR
jgi:drug/metabolite transporter (DMT)-like permease